MNSRFIILLCLIVIAIFAELLRYSPINKRCKNCKFYSQNSHYECKETIEDFVSDKESRNFCDYFSPMQFFSPSDKQDKAQKAKDAFNSLFGGIVCL